MTRALILAGTVAAFASPVALQAANSGPRPKTQTLHVQRHAAPHIRVPAANHTPDVTLKRGAIGN